MNEELTNARKYAIEELESHRSTKRRGWCDACTERTPCSVQIDQEAIIAATSEVLRLEGVIETSIAGIRERKENVGRIFQRLYNSQEHDRE